jgi:hypothetical protein
VALKIFKTLITVIAGRRVLLARRGREGESAEWLKILSVIFKDKCAAGGGRGSVCCTDAPEDT